MKKNYFAFLLFFVLSSLAFSQQTLTPPEGAATDDIYYDNNGKPYAVFYKILPDFYHSISVQKYEEGTWIEIFDYSKDEYFGSDFSLVNFNEGESSNYFNILFSSENDLIMNFDFPIGFISYNYTVTYVDNEWFDIHSHQHSSSYGYTDDFESIDLVNNKISLTFSSYYNYTEKYTITYNLKGELLNTLSLPIGAATNDIYYDNNGKPYAVFLIEITEHTDDNFSHKISVQKYEEDQWIEIFDDSNLRDTKFDKNSVDVNNTKLLFSDTNDLILTYDVQDGFYSFNNTISYVDNEWFFIHNHTHYFSGLGGSETDTLESINMFNNTIVYTIIPYFGEKYTITYNLKGEVLSSKKHSKIPNLNLSIFNKSIVSNLSNISIEVYTILGSKIPNENLQANYYIVKASDRSGNQQSFKIATH